MKNIFKKDNIRNKQVVALLFVIGLILMVVGISYAMYTFSGTGTKENVITTGQITVEFAEQNNILIQNRYPETDAVGLASTDEKSQMTFTVSSNITGTATVNYAVGLAEIEEGATLTEDYIKINLTKNGSASSGFTSDAGNTIKSFENETFSDLLTSHVIARGVVSGTQTDTYTLKAWIHEDYNLPTTDTSSGKVHSSTTTSEEFSFKIKVAGTDATINEEEEPNIPNAPELATNMIPVTYDGTTWVKADGTNSNNSWYNYDNKVWANAVTVTDYEVSERSATEEAPKAKLLNSSTLTREQLVNLPVGSVIPMERINTMWVWIPSFSATMGYVDCSTVVEQSVEKYPMCYDVSVTDDDKTKIAGFLGQMGVEDTEAVVADLVAGETVNVQGADVDLAFVVNYWNSYVVQQDPTATPINPTYEFDSTKSGNRQSFDIKFTRTSETSHDAFTFGDDNIAGFWMAKFEVSHPTLSDVSESNLLGCTNDTCENAKAIEILPNKVSLRRNNVSNFFYAGRSIEQSGNNYGLVADEVDTHMLKNNEWGAVAYLTYSEFGRCTDDYVCTDIGINNEGTTDGWDTIKTGYGVPAGSAVGVENGAYDTALGMDASTTGNIYGVYDMSGGAHEYVMGVYKPDTLDGIRDYSGFSTETSNSQYDKLTIGTQYYNVYTTSEAYDNAGLQHAVNETNGWYNDGASFVSSEHPWFERGGGFDAGGFAGVFSAVRNYGDALSDGSFRPTLVK